jgi:CRP-like cAMP-binding protein
MSIDVVEALRHAELFRDLSDPLLSALADKAIVKGLSRDEILFVNCYAHPEIAMTALGVLSRRLRKCAELVETLSLRAVGQRLAQWFLNEARIRGRELDQGIEIELALSREQMAARVGSVREVVSRAITRLDQEGLVRVEGDRALIPDIQRLAEYIEHT